MDVDKLQHVGEMLALSIMTIARDPSY